MPGGSAGQDTGTGVVLPQHIIDDITETIATSELTQEKCIEIRDRIAALSDAQKCQLIINLICENIELRERQQSFAESEHASEAHSFGQTEGYMYPNYSDLQLLINRQVAFKLIGVTKRDEIKALLREVRHNVDQRYICQMRRYNKISGSQTYYQLLNVMVYDKKVEQFIRMYGQQSSLETITPEDIVRRDTMLRHDKLGRLYYCESLDDAIAFW